MAMTDIRAIKAEIRGLLAAATPGLWSASQTHATYTTVWSPADPGDRVADVIEHGDATFIAAARNHFPAILDHADEMERERDEARAKSSWGTEDATTGALNQANARADAAEKALADVRRRVAELEEALRPAREALREAEVCVDADQDVETWHAVSSAVGRLSALLADTKGGADAE